MKMDYDRPECNLFLHYGVKTIAQDNNFLASGAFKEGMFWGLNSFMAKSTQSKRALDLGPMVFWISQSF
jgi:hypothetical protein